MKEIKLVHVGIALALVLLLIAISQWAKIPKNVPPPTAESFSEASQFTELPILPQNEPSKPVAVPFAEKEPSLSERSSLENNDAPKDPAMSKKPEL